MHAPTEPIRSRTRNALQAKKRRGERVGSVPRGFRPAENGWTLVPDDDEQAVLGLLHKFRASGHTLRAIADELTARGYRTRRGKRWYHSYVCVQLARDRAGRR